jgi:hypothetical protein
MIEGIHTKGPTHLPETIIFLYLVPNLMEEKNANLSLPSR